MNKKLEMKGWVEPGEEYTNVPSKCPECEGPLWRTNALRTCGIYIVGCKDNRCRWCAIFEE